MAVYLTLDQGNWEIVFISLNSSSILCFVMFYLLVWGIKSLDVHLSNRLLSGQENSENKHLTEHLKKKKEFISGRAKTAFKSILLVWYLTKQLLWGCCLVFNSPLGAATRLTIAGSSPNAESTCALCQAWAEGRDPATTPHSS